ncbi:MAG: 50S ribosomal protein L1 [Verrucomicrobia bacterium]|jgi:large subunit ribosomal protein L1|nr:50S ribosomal protein L1 [Verrucomicrobiota bacterium]
MKTKSSKRYRAALQVADLKATYDVAQAADIIKKMPSAKFDETVEISAFLGVDPKQSDQMVRGTVSLPNGSGKKIKVIAFTENPKEALDAGADFAGLADMIAKVNGGFLDFDVAVSTTSAMKEVRQVARVLGPKGLMPNPKSGTVSDDLAKTIKEVKAGRVEFKMDKTGNIVIVVGKKSFTAKQLAENAEAALAALVKSQPVGFAGGRFIKSLTISSSMSPGVSIDLKPYSATISA